jgi:pyrroloquinoline quinone biosynthesis protein E
MSRPGFEKWRANFLLLRSALPVLKVLLGARIPLRIIQYITMRCNLDCRYCARHEVSGRELTTAEVKALMFSFRRAGTLFWGFNGGEPLLREDIGELIDHAKTLGLFVNIATNGILIPARRRAVGRADLVNLSLEGPKDVHDSLRSRSFDQLQAAIRMLQEDGVKFSFLTVINRTNIDVLEDILTFAEENRSSVAFQPVRLQKEDRTGKSPGYFPTREEMGRAADFLLAAKRKGRPVASSARFLQEIKATWPDDPPRKNCWAGRVFCSLAPNGVITACCDTLVLARKKDTTATPDHPVDEFLRLPNYRCGTCFSAFPLETNLAMSMGRRNPLGLLQENLSSLLR